MCRVGLPDFLLVMGRTAAVAGKRNKRFELPLYRIGVTGFEPATSSSRTKRSTKLSYTPWIEPAANRWWTVIDENCIHHLNTRPIAEIRTEL